MKTENRKCSKCGTEFILDQDDFSFYEKMKVPMPQICPDCRFKMRALWRNEISLYNRKCAGSDVSIVSNYNPVFPYIVFSNNYYYSDKWDVKKIYLDYDLKKDFLSQLKELFLKVPKPATFSPTINGVSVNSEYVNYASNLKNCFMVFNTGPAEESMYSRGVRYSREVVDSYYVVDSSELIYENVNCSKSSRIIFGNNVNGCVDCIFVTNVSGCINCFGCVNVRNVSYQIFNKQYSKDEYFKFVSGVLGSFEKIEKFKKKFNEFEKKFPMKENHNLKSVNSTGDYLSECKNFKNSFECFKGEDCNFVFSTTKLKDSIGVIGYGTNCERLLECVSVGNASNMIGSLCIVDSRNIEYSSFLKNCHDCIGCDGLKNSSYCILNKQYSEEEYFKLREHILNELKEKEIYGLMMPPELAPFACNETIAQDNMPLTKEEALTQGFRWEDDIQKTEGKETIKSEEIPDHINDIKDDITKEILKCVECNRNYKITEQELRFYRKMILPIPRKCFYCRHKNRVERRGPYKFWDRKCDKCNKDIKTNYAPDRPEIVYCESCYNKEVY